MKALMYTAIGKMEMQEVKKPEEGTIIQVKGCGICGTDLKTFLHGHPYFIPPTILGHEFYGEIVRRAPSCTYDVGDLVVVAPYYECGKCDVCRSGRPELCQEKTYVSSGAFCEYVSVPDGYRGLFPIDKARYPEETRSAFTLVEPLSCVLNGISRLHITPVSNVLIVGGGPMGILFALYFQQQGIPCSLVEPNESRRAKLKSWNLTGCTPDEVGKGTYDNIVVAVNKPELITTYMNVVKDGGVVLMFAGMPSGTTTMIDNKAIHYREVTLAGTSGFGLGNFTDSYHMVAADPRHYLKLITDTFPLEQGMEAFSILSRGEAFKIVLKP